MSELRTALADALGPLYRIEREVRPVGEYRLFVASQSQNGTELLVKVLPAALSLGIDDLHRVLSSRCVPSVSGPSLRVGFRALVQRFVSP